MLVYHASKENFQEDVLGGKIADIVKEKILEHGINDQNPAEFNAWTNSLMFMRMALENQAIPSEAEVAIEYQIPLTSKRVDFMIAGADDSGRDNVGIIELKQWTSADKVSDASPHTVRAFTGGALREVAHPCYQAYSYRSHIENYSQFAEERKVALSSVAYCHNYARTPGEGLLDPVYSLWLSEAPLFTKEENRALSEFIAKRIHKKSEDGEILYKIDHGKIRPAKALQDCLSSMVKGSKEFQLLDEQSVVYDKIMEAFLRSCRDKKKRVLIVKGGPGTGKAVLAVNILCDLINAKEGHGFHAAYLTKNSAPRKVYLKLLSKGDLKKEVAIEDLFRSPFGLHNLPDEFFDCLLIDEAHRLVKQMFRDYGGENQIKEAIHASLVSVFFLDETQRISVKDIGTAEGIKKAAHPYFDGEDFDFRIYDDACSLQKAIQEKERIGGKSRLVAGYCYDWNVKNNRGPIDILLDDGRFQACWNDPNKSSLFAIDPKQKDMVGCIHTVQGLEFDYVGVIIGRDLRYENGAVITDPGQVSKDDKSSGIRSCKDKALADSLIRNTYKVLLTRGQKGCYVYCEDPSLREYLKTRIDRRLR